MEDHSKITCILLFVSVLAAGRVAALTFQYFTLLRNECFGATHYREWKPDSALSVENFIYMVEKIERNYDGKAADLIRELLASFSCNRITNMNVGNDLNRDNTGKWFEVLMGKYINGEQPTISLKLTKEEKCQLLFLLSPTVLSLLQKDESEGDTEKATGFGVLTLNANKQQAVDLSKVLYGIYAGLKGNPRKLIKDLVDLDDDNQGEVSLLYASTISEVINAALTKHKEFIAENYKDEGAWDSKFCPKHYLYENKKFSWPTTAEIRGAVDGLRLGTKIKDMGNKENVKLSQIIRMYYSRDGLRDDSTDQHGVSYCNQEFYSNDDLVTETINYMRAYRAISHEAVQDGDVENIKKYVDSFKGSFQEAVVWQDNEGCPPKVEAAVDICETPSNVFVVLDQRNNNISFQKYITGELINSLNIGLDEDAITIYSNANVEDLHRVVNASESKAEASCEVEAFNPYVLPSAEDSKVLTDIKNIITVYDENQKSLRAVPAKVVVYFNFGVMKPEEERALEKVRRELKSRHRNLHMIPIGIDSEYLGTYFTNNQPSRALSWLEPELSKNLKEKVCLAPAVLQHPSCKSKSKFEDSASTGYIGNYRVQHWAMYPQHFLKTFGYKFQFKAQYGSIRVCFSRSGPVEDADSKNCKGQSTDGEPVEFSGRNPCKGRTVHNCDPFYFSVFGRDDDKKSTCHREIDGTFVGCKRLDLIEYTIKHEGISCSSGRKIISSPFLQVLLAFLVIFYILKQHK